MSQLTPKKPQMNLFNFFFPQDAKGHVNKLAA